MRKIYLSNQLENLAESLKKNLLEGLLPFQKQIVIVPSLAIKTHLSLSLATDPELRVFAGIRLCVLSEALGEFFRESEKKLPKFLELSLLIERELYQLIETGAQEIQGDRHLFSSQKQIAYLSDQLSRLFLLYGIFCEDLVQQWEQTREGGWQQVIWRRLFSSDTAWSYSAALLKEVKKITSPLHLFGFSFLPKIYFQFFKRQDALFYLLSPCRYFWSDLYSDKQRMHLYKKVHAFKINEEERRAADLYFESENRLLANFGKMGRELARLIEDEQCALEENYVENSDSFLRCVQRDLVNLQTSEMTNSSDRSFQLYAASSKLQEVEMLLENLVALMTEDAAIAPKDILVLCPSIEEYLSFIHFVFSKKLNYKINHLEMTTQSAFAQGLVHLLNVPKLRYEAQAVLKLLTFPPFLEKRGWGYEEVSKIKKWIKDANIQWAISSAQKALFLKKNIPHAEQGTWSDGSERLLESLVYVDEKREVIEFSDALLFGNWTELIFSLDKDLQPILDDQEESLSFWIEWIKRVIETYFVLSEDAEKFCRELDELRVSPLMKLRFESFKRVALHLLKQRGASFQASKIQAVTFSSLNNGNVLPFKVIYLLGMHEEVFPRKETSLSFSFLKNRSDLDYCPSRAEEDRWLFLEVLLSARSYLWISYLSKDPRDGKELAPSPLIDELSSQYPLDEKRLPRRSSARAAEKAPFFLPAFHLEKPFNAPKKEGELIIDIKHLSQLARNPLRFYFNRALGIYLEKEEERTEFTFSALDKAILRQNSLKEDPLALIEDADRAGILPRGGIFKSIAQKRLLEEIAQRDHQLERLSAAKESVFSAQLTMTCKTPYTNGQGERFFPPLKISLEDGRSVHLVGKIEGLSPEGILFHGKQSLKDLVKIWPLFLSAQLLPVAIKPAILFTKSGENRSFSLSAVEALQKYIAYYERAYSNVSPLLPDWASALLQGEHQDLEKAMRATYTASQNDPYLQWLVLRDPLPAASLLFQHWAPFLREVLCDALMC
jgi:exodeoxyribonuclease V gamma subunit